MRGLPFETLLNWALAELEHNGSMFGLHRSLFYVPPAGAPYAGELWGHHLAAPLGPAAGPHTQLAQNIVCAWLSGARFIELKTVQVMDELEIPRPCIDMADEGYNVEWSQELKLDRSADEYVKAWALIHVLRRVLGLEGRVPFGTVFNMSVGYDLQGIQSAPMTRFVERLQDASEQIAAIQSFLQQRLGWADLEIPARISDNVTLSTMHGCPPDEIERIARYLLEERGLHTVVKLNPTLLGRERVRRILHEELGYGEIHVPDAAFDHDLRYERALALIRSLQGVARRCGRSFGVKLSNTLAVANHRGVLPGDEMYMSGRALYPITMALFQRLAHDLDGKLDVSYSAGADALNVTAILASGARPVTMASELLKPGGYSRLAQVLENLERDMRARGAANLDELAREGRKALSRAAAEALENPRYARAYHPDPLPKVESPLGLLDCIAAPCVEQCAVRQDVPEYAAWIARGQPARALEVILARNPLPGVTGHVCTHLCQTRCTRSNTDQPVAIRALKRFAAQRGAPSRPAPAEPGPPSDARAAIVGSGPSGLAAAYFLALSGVRTTVYEARERAGGMLALAPAFRLPPEVVEADVERIAALGVEIRLSTPVASPRALLDEGYDAVYLACGFPGDARLEIEGIGGEGVYPALDLLERVARRERPELGAHVLVIGGGNTAMDAARCAQRLTGRPATVVYRRTRAEMPAENEEVVDLLAEGNALLELASPQRVIRRGGRVAALECVRNVLGEPGPDGRRRPAPIPGSAFQIEASAVIVATGQRPDVAFLDGSGLALRPNGAIAVDPDTGRTGAAGVYAGGDATRGPAIIIEACADGRRAAEAICAQLGLPFCAPPLPRPAWTEAELLQLKRARARLEMPCQPPSLPVAQRGGFDLVEGTLSAEDARHEAARCLQCATLCDKCVEVCPNRANVVYRAAPLCWQLPLLSCRGSELAVAGHEPFAVTQERQILHLHDLCNECGNCATFCVHPGRPYADKPRLFLRLEEWARERDNAWLVAGNVLRRREGGSESRLERLEEGWRYEDARVRVRLSPAFEVVEMALREPFAGTLSLRPAAEMAVVLRGIQESLPFLVELQ